jgi:murein DD-endopeptidase MepM/ murein hydrolase activator NlpD
MPKIAPHYIKTKYSSIVSLMGALLLITILGACASAPSIESPADQPSLDTPETLELDLGVDALDPALLPAFNQETKTGGLQREIDMHTIIPDRPRMQVVTYLVQRGDTLFGIADKFGIKPESVLWGNWETMEGDPHTIQPGQELNIPPINGVLHTWEEDDNLYKVAEFFRTTPEEILDWPGNNISYGVDLEDPGIEPGTLVMVPEGERDPPSWQMVSITRSNPAAASILGPGYCGSVYSGPIGDGFFGWPTPNQWVSGYVYVVGLHEAVDIGGSVGVSIYAADDGVVVYSGWNNYGYGYVIVIDHGNGWQTLYAHLDTINVGCGQAVFQGNVIGTMGVTGNSSGPHLHFEMRSDIWGRVNPISYLP